MSFEEYWQEYIQTNEAWRGMSQREAARVGWLGRNRELEYYTKQVVDLIKVGQNMQKEVLQLRVDIARLRAKQEGESDGQG